MKMKDSSEVYLQLCCIAPSSPGMFVFFNMKGDGEKYLMPGNKG